MPEAAENSPQQPGWTLTQRAMEESMETLNVSATMAHGLVARRPRAREAYDISTRTCINLNAPCFSLPQFQYFFWYLDPA